MRKFVLISILLAVLMHGYAQTSTIYNTDSLKRLLATRLDDTTRIWVLNNLCRNLPNSDSTLVLADQVILLSQKAGFKKGEAEAYASIGHWLNQKGNYPGALESYLKAIQLSEEVNYDAGLKRSYNSLATVYLYMKDYRTAIGYGQKARSLSVRFKDDFTRALCTSWISRSYLQMQKLDSALKYAQESYEAAVREKTPFPMYVATGTLGDVNAALGAFPLALEYLRMSLRFSRIDGRYFRIAMVHQQLAEAFRRAGMTDSCMVHAKQAFSISESANLPGTLLSSSLLLSELHEGKNDSESLRFRKLAMVAQDSLYSQEKNQRVEALNFAETIRQRELAAARIQEEQDRKHNLQYAAIALGLVFFLIVFLVLSHSVVANEGLIRFLGVLALLIVFEFINLLLHPFLGDLTHHSPVLMLLSMVCVAAMLIPLHHRLEKWVINKLVEKNNRIRLEAAKKVIAKLER